MRGRALHRCSACSPSSSRWHVHSTHATCVCVCACVGLCVCVRSHVHTYCATYTSIHRFKVHAHAGRHVRCQIAPHTASESCFESPFHSVMGKCSRALGSKLRGKAESILKWDEDFTESMRLLDGELRAQWLFRGSWHCLQVTTAAV